MVSRPGRRQVQAVRVCSTLDVATVQPVVHLLGVACVHADHDLLVGLDGLAGEYVSFRAAPCAVRSGLPSWRPLIAAPRRQACEMKNTAARTRIAQTNTDSFNARPPGAGTESPGYGSPSCA